MEFDAQGRLFGIHRTELELKAIQNFRDVLKEPFGEDVLKSPQHLLCEFYDGYSRKDSEGCYEYNFDNSKEIHEGIETFLNIVGKDMDGELDYTEDCYDKIFGLIKELGL